MVKKRSHGDGALYELKSRGLWRGVVDAGFTTDGKRKQLYVHAKTQRACRDKLEALKAEITKHGVPQDKKTTVEQWSTQWLVTDQSENDPNTHSSNKSAVTKWITPTIGNKPLSTLKPSDVRAVRTALVNAGRAPATVNRSMAVLSAMLKGAVDEGLIDSNPAAAVKKLKLTTTKKRGAFTAEQAIMLLATSAKYPNASGARWWFKLLTGQRQGETLGAVLADLDLERGVYQVNWKLEELMWDHACDPTCGKRWARHCPTKKLRVPDDFEYTHLQGRYFLTRPKSATGRLIPLIPQLVEALRRHIEATAHLPNPHGLLFPDPTGAPIDAKIDAQEWRQLLLDTGLITAEENRAGGTTLTGHWARHTTVSVLASMGVDYRVIADIVGHGAEAVTELYRHSQIEDLHAAMSKLGQAFELDSDGVPLLPRFNDVPSDT